VIQRILTFVVVVAVALVLACVDMSAPNGPAAISGLQLPSPSVVINDVMRDSAGNPAPLKIIAYDAAGKPTDAVGAQFFITDTAKAAQLNGDNILSGKKIGATVIVGQIGSLQTPSVTVQVTFAPFKMEHVGTDTTFVVPFSADTLASAVTSISLRVLSAEDSASQGIVVRYALIKAPAAKNPPRTAVFIGDNNSKLASADTTSSSGTSTRRIVVFPALLGDAALLSGAKTDTVIVEARASYKGAPLTGSPVTFKVPIRVVFK
jgi:hypothetical protein